MLKKVPVKDSVGLALGHDLTKVIPGKFKGTAFTRGHIVREEDIPELLAMGKEHVYVYEPELDEIHEDEAARRLAAALAGEGVGRTEPREGRVNLVAERQGLLRVRRDAVYALNARGGLAVSTLHDCVPVEAGEVVAATRIIPLVIPATVLEEAEKLCRDRWPVVEVKRYRSLRAGVIVTGSEVYYGRIQDAFVPKVKEKLEAYGSHIAEVVYLPDGAGAIAESIKKLVGSGLEIILVCGGMSVDADDTTPAGIRESGAEVIIHGTPVFPGAMFMLAYHGEIAVMGLPACVIHDATTIFDLVLPRLLAGEKVTRDDIVAYGVGGLCRHCRPCTYPTCSFGK